METKRRGRPCKEVSERRSRQVRIRVRPREFGLLSEAAERAGQPVATWSRNMLVTMARRS